VSGQLVVRGDKVLMVAPGRADAARCLLDTGALPGGFLVCHAPHRLVVQAVDAYGNLCSGGGERVSLLLRGPGQREVKTAAGEDMRDGTYAVPTEVRWRPAVGTMRRSRPARGLGQPGVERCPPVARVLRLWPFSRPAPPERPRSAARHTTRRGRAQGSSVVCRGGLRGGLRVTDGGGGLCGG
jgi:hypothetical protein